MSGKKTYTNTCTYRNNISSMYFASDIDGLHDSNLFDDSLRKFKELILIISTDKTHKIANDMSF